MARHSLDPWPIPKDKMPLYINRVAVIRRITTIVAQIEIYDQIWFARTMPLNRKHSVKATELVHEVFSLLKEIPDGCAEVFPFELIDVLEMEYV